MFSTRKPEPSQAILAPKYVVNWIIHQDTNLNTLKEEIRNFALNYKEKIRTHPLELPSELYKIIQTQKN